jgi:hypothetical protein
MFLGDAAVLPQLTQDSREDLVWRIVCGVHGLLWPIRPSSAARYRQIAVVRQHRQTLSKVVGALSRRVLDADCAGGSDRVLHEVSRAGLRREPLGYPRSSEGQRPLFSEAAQLFGVV